MYMFVAAMMQLFNHFNQTDN